MKSPLALHIKLKHFPRALVFVLFAFAAITQCSATIYYSRQTGNWNATSTWSTVTYGDPTNAGTYPVLGDLVYIGDGHSIQLTASQQCSGLNIGQGSSGTVYWPSFGSITLTISGSLTINAGATLWYNLNNTRTHNLFVSGSITNNGTLDLFSDANDGVNLTLNGAAHCVVDGTGSFFFNNVTLNKSLRTYQLDVRVGSFLTAAPPASSAPCLVLTKGTLLYNSSSTTSWSDPSSTSETIPMDIILEVRAGTLKIVEYGDTLINSGRIYVTGGTLEVCSSAGNKGIFNQDAGANNPEIEVEAGTLKCFGGITSFAGTNPWVFKLTNGTVDINSGTTGTDLPTLYIENTSGAQCVINAGNIYIRKPSSNSAYSEFDFGSSNVYHNVTGGTVNFGNATTAYTFDYYPYASYVYPNMKVFGASGTILRPKTVINSQMLGLHVTSGNTFDVSSAGSNATSTQVTLTNTLDGIYALYNEGTFEERTGTVVLAGTTNQYLYSLSPQGSLYNLTVNNTAGVTLDTPIDIVNALTLTNGIVQSSTTNILTMNAGSSVSGVSNSSYVNGPVTKVGNTAFTFPVGASSMYRAITMSAPSAATDAFTAQYYYTDPDPVYDRQSLALSLDHVSAMEYWILDRTTGTSDVDVTLTWNPSSGGVDSLPGLRVCRWDGAAWQDHGNGLTTGTTANGTVITSAPVSNFSPFTLGSARGNNPLPVELAEFSVKQYSNGNSVAWTTLSEINNDYFILEKSINGFLFNYFETIKGNGNSSVPITYETWDNNPYPGMTCYRLKQVDFNGDYKYVASKCVTVDRMHEVSVSPTLLSSEDITVNIGNFDGGKVTVHITDITGRTVFSSAFDSGNFVIKHSGISGNGNRVLFMRLAINDEPLYDTKMAVVK